MVGPTAVALEIRNLRGMSEKQAVHLSDRAGSLSGTCLGRIGQRLDQVKAALGLSRSRPSTCSGVFSGAHGAGAMSATNAGIFAIMQHVVGRVMLADVLPYLLGIPVGEGVNFHQTKFFIPFNFSGAGAGSGLIAADAGDPGLQFAQ